MEVDFYYVVACQCGAITITTVDGSTQCPQRHS